MENLIIILSVLLNIALIIAVAIYMHRFNKTHNDLTMSIENYSNLVKEKSLLEEEKKSIKNVQQYYAQKCDQQNAKIESLLSINNTLVNDNRKLSDELQEIKSKPFDPLKELDNLTIRKDEKPTPEVKQKPKTKKGLKINYPDKNDFRNNV